MKFPPRDKSSNDKNGQAKGTKTFLQIKDGDTIKAVFVGDSVKYYSKWENKKELSSPTLLDGYSERYKSNVIVNENGELTTKIWSFSGATRDKLADIDSTYPLDQTLVKITRTGSSKEDTDYKVLALVGPLGLTTAQLEAIKKMPRLDMDSKSEKLVTTAKETFQELPF